MDFFVSPEIRDICFGNDVWIESGVSVGRLAPRKIGIEGPARLKRGIYDIDLIGAYTYFGADCMFYHVGSIGRFCSIASAIQAGDAEHPAHFLSPHPLFQADPAWTDTAWGFLSRNRAMIDRSREKRQAIDAERFGKIQIGNDVWIGEGVFIRRGIEIGDGAVIGARSVVTRDVPPYAIVGGAPAKLIRYRFEPDVIAALLDLQWWLYGLSALENVDFTDVRGALAGIYANISSGRATFYQGPVLSVGQDEVDILDFDRDSGRLVPRG